MKGKYTCQNDVMSIRCLPSKVIRIFRATYLRENPQICSGDGFNSTEHCNPVDKTTVIGKLCDKRATCNISVDEKTMGDHCPFVATEYLNVIYGCRKLLTKMWFCPFLSRTNRFECNEFRKLRQL